MEDTYPTCEGPFGNARVEYPVNFDLRIIYALAEAPNLEASLEKALAAAGVPCTLIQGISKPGAKYGRMGARVTVDSETSMKKLYSMVSAIPGVKTVI